MAYRVPDDEAILAAARTVLRSAKSVVSQREMRTQVLRELRHDDASYTLGEERVRRLLAVQPFVRLEMRARKGSKERVLTRCPVCGTKLGRLKNQTLFGGEVTLTLRCPACHYWSGKEKRIPTLYIFHFGGPTGPGSATRETSATPQQPF